MEEESMKEKLLEWIYYVREGYKGLYIVIHG